MPRPEDKAFYNSKAWRNARKAQLAHEPFCRRCNRVLATQVDHIKPISEGGDRLAPSNLQSLCHSCHSVKTTEDMSGRTKAATGADGLPVDARHPFYGRQG